MKRKVLLVVLFVIILLPISGCKVKKADTEELVRNGKKLFLQNDYEVFMQRLKDASGFDDLSAELEFSYQEESDYYIKTKQLNVYCKLLLYSDMIDVLYTTEYNSVSSKNLASVMDSINDVFENDASYTYQIGNSTVVFILRKEDNYGFSVRTSKGRKYKFTSIYNDSVSIDGQIVYYSDEQAGTSSVSNKQAETKESSTKVSNKQAETKASSTNSKISFSAPYDATLKYGTGKVEIFASEEALDRYTTAMVNHYEGTILEMAMNFEVAYTEENTRCNIVKEKLTRTQVKLLDGSYAGNTVWVYREAVQKK